MTQQDDTALLQLCESDGTRRGGETEETDDDASKKRQWMGKEDCCIFFALPLLPKPTLEFSFVRRKERRWKHGGLFTPSCRMKAGLPRVRQQTAPRRKKGLMKKERKLQSVSSITQELDRGKEERERENIVERGRQNIDG